jgi:zinc transport system ATP-binding protein
MESLVEFESVSKSYDKKIVVEGISFKINPSTINVLVGPNGAGKTTIAKILAGVITPSFGLVKEKLGLKKSYIPQQSTRNSSMPITCSELSEILELSKNAIMDSFYDSELELDRIWNKQLSEISSGQAQLFMVSTAFASNADLIILDEPTSFLDIDFESRFYNKLEEIIRDKGRSVFIISHELHSVVKSADQVLCINHHICCTGKPFASNNDLIANIGTYHHTHDHTH